MQAQNRVEMRVVSSVEAARRGRIVRCFGEDLSGPRFGLWELAFKPNTDDMRESPSLDIIKGLVSRRGAVIAYDPVATDNARLAIGNSRGVSFAATAMDVVRGADAPVIGTEWRKFRSPDFPAIKAALKTPVIFDGRNLLEPSDGAMLGFEYHAIGQPVPAAGKG